MIKTTQNTLLEGLEFPSDVEFAFKLKTFCYEKNNNSM